MLMISRTEHKTNEEEMLQTAEARMELLDTLRTRQKKWLGHVLRQDSLLRTLLETAREEG